MQIARNRRTRAIAVAGAALLALPLAACSAGGDDDATGDENVELSFLVWSDPQEADVIAALSEAFTEENPNITFDLELRPGGGEGDNIVKTRLATGEMNDMFAYNSGSLFQALGPDQTLANLDDQDWVGSLDDTYIQTISTDSGVYGAPMATSMAGAMLYNIPLYEELGLEVPQDWDEFMANNEAVLAAGEAAPIAQTYADTWTSQLFVLGDFGNVYAQDPSWAEEYTAGNAKYVDQPALQGFLNQQETFEAGLFNEDFASATFDDGIRMVATGEAAHYPMLTFVVSSLISNYPDNLNDVGIFPIPAQDAADTTLTTWQPTSVYIPNTTEGAQLEAAKQFMAFIASPEGCAIYVEVAGATGPFVVDGCDLPAEVPQLVTEMQPYFDEGRTAPALEFLSPIKGPALEQITVEVGSGIRSAEDGAALYDEDVEKQAAQLGLDW